MFCRKTLTALATVVSSRCAAISLAGAEEVTLRMAVPDCRRRAS